MNKTNSINPNDFKIKQLNNEKYQEYIKERSPKTSTIKNCLFAFVSGGIICTFAEFLKDFFTNKMKLDKDNVERLVPMILIFLSSLLTGLNVYDSIAKIAGAGTLVPITGFANSIVSPAMEFKKEGYIFGVASKMFIIAGPVLVYGISVSIIIGSIFVVRSLFANN